jgi:hypothetical protein
MIVGGRREIFLAPVLESLAGSVDRLVVNVNGDCPANLEVLAESRLGRQGRVEVLRSAFQDFASARNLCLEAVGPETGRPRWVMFVDADDMHTPGLQVLTRGLLGALPEDVGLLDVYMLELMQSFRRYVGLYRAARKLCRWVPGLRWSRSVHEKLQGSRGSRWTLPYVFLHLGYVKPPEEILGKWTQYASLGDPSYSLADLQAASPQGLFDLQARASHPLRGRLPEVLARWLAEEGLGRADYIQRCEALPLGPQEPWPRLRHRLAEVGAAGRVAWRTLPTWLRLLARPRALAALYRLVVESWRLVGPVRRGED